MVILAQPQMFHLILFGMGGNSLKQRVPTSCRGAVGGQLSTMSISMEQHSHSKVLVGILYVDGWITDVHFTNCLFLQHYTGQTIIQMQRSAGTFALQEWSWDSCEFELAAGTTLVKHDRIINAYILN